ELLDRAVQFVAAAFAARPDHHVGGARLDWAHQRGNVLRVVGAVGVDEDDDLAGGQVERAAQRLTLAFAAIELDAGPVRLGNLAGRVGRMAVDDKHFVRVRRHRVDDIADQAFLILRGDDYGDTGVWH